MSDQGQLHRKSPIFGKVPEALMHDLTITDGAVRLYAHMHWRYGRNRQFFEKLETIANWMGISERAVRDRILELESADWVIVISRRNPKSHTARVNKYHIFEDRQDARDFREAPPADELDEYSTIRPKSEVDQRKGRAGHGGKPAHKAASTGTQVPLDNRNSGSNGNGDVNRNSGSKELEAPVLNQTHSVDATASTAGQSSTPVESRTAALRDYGNRVAEHIEALPPVSIDDFGKTDPAEGYAVAPPPPRTEPLQDLKTALFEVYGWDNEGVLHNYGRMLRGIKGRKGSDYDTYKFSVPMTADELWAFAAWWKRQHPDLTLPSSPEGMAKHISAYRATAQAKPADPFAGFTFSEAPAAPVDDRATVEARLAEIKRLRGQS